MPTPNNEAATTSMPLNKAAWLETLAALELEFIAFQNQRSLLLLGDIAPAAAATQGR
jgi:hypothetical protein